ncbi:TetR/AcrR family transcriptional regulator [Gordonia sp. (in: high G+C Gram-positive bacteria)]|jgi:AcrR family transcriptional regulator|uniref:TetR/AcrR family transcriptional regulator n=1 Tax=Gordonia sp. (in: high G+C Gram-positive bacteria) TaxID=84139 RepID=UPI001DADE5CF|nr:TetR/AcrR family transcriptional regulator [Gordonia sp. (in: high G+C Gram-positive bacteria)]MCB1296882.1 TetR family transcriptional regulator [Gordonia sp. (in: high G+C Gram-positive bacteria)]HMS74101.1 TetR/AcrR family transcriptional regulator [Gordonia sp. (in: high G+C Gram-positive bacteria)]HQV19796.1 TetR/AcrR family transcriptional regulator [Gordonia sp. (in: high G+C Gram-positive bacteria)]
MGQLDVEAAYAAPLVSDSPAATRMRRAAVEMFARDGFGGTSTRQIAKHLNLSPAAMYPHYKSKEELLYAIAVDGHGQILDELRSVDADTAGGPEQRLQAVVAAFACWQARHHEHAKVVQYELHALAPEHYRVVAAMRRDTVDIIETIVRQGIRDGVFTVEHPDDAVLAISSLCVDVCRWFPSRTHSDPVALGTAYAELALRMVT